MEYTNIRATANNNENTHFSPPHLSSPHHESNSQVSPTFSPLPCYTTPTPPTAFYPLLHTFVPPHHDSVVDPIRLKSTNSFLQAEERSPSFSLNFSLFIPARHGFYRRPSESLHTKICTNTISAMIRYYFSFFPAPTAS